MEEDHDLISELINHKPFFRTAPVKLGFSIIQIFINKNNRKIFLFNTEYQHEQLVMQYKSDVQFKLNVSGNSQ